MTMADISIEGIARWASQARVSLIKQATMSM